jgi:hypothetical protein
LITPTASPKRMAPINEIRNNMAKKCVLFVLQGNRKPQRRTCQRPFIGSL